MSLRASVTDRALDLPPAYELVTLRERGDAFAHACAVGEARGAGTLVWTRRFDVAEFALVLEPEDPLGAARRAVYLGMNALANALAVQAPPEMPLTFDWPDAVRIDGVLVGGGRLGWPEGVEEAEVPPWLVFGATIRTVVMRAGDPGLRPLFGGLEEVGFEGADAGEIVAAFARYFMAGLHDWAQDGFAAVSRSYRRRLAGEAADEADLGSLRDALLVPAWRDPATGMPWL